MSRFYQYDGLGSTRSLSDATGAVTDTYAGACPERSRRDAYGLLLEHTGASANPYLYRGEQYDPETDAYYLRARYYQPGIGRFMTTDPVEGFPNAPLSLHRYMYGNDNPVNFLDPSGQMSLTEKLITANIIGILANVATGVIGQTGPGKNVMYPFLAEYVYPEAYVIGANITGSFPSGLLANIIHYLEMLFSQSPISINITQELLRNVSDAKGTVLGCGLELLLSIGSGEAALFATPTGGSVWGIPNVSFGLVEAYDGAVFNMWNAQDYNGPFESLSLNLGIQGVELAYSLFWDADRGFDGPWGGTNSFFRWKQWSVFQQNFSFAKLDTQYLMLGKPLPSNRMVMYSAIIGTIYAKIALAGIVMSGTGNLQGILEAGTNCIFGATLWGNVLLAHQWWNVKEPLYNETTRQTTSRLKDMPRYHSGPAYPLLQ